MKLVIDTDIFIDFLRGYEESKKWFSKLNSQELFMSVITEAELLSGKSCNDNKKLKETILAMQIASKILVNSLLAQKAGELRRTYNTPLADSLIAAAAILYRAKLITKNVRDYSKIKELELEKPY